MTIRLRIERLGHLGDGIASDPDGRPLFIPRMLPDEEIDAQVSEPGDGPGVTDARIVTPSPDRVRAPCQHYRTCGGCALQHAADPFVANWKREVVRGALASHGIETEILGPDTSPAQSRRRATFALKRGKNSVLIGFHGAGSHTIVDTPGCLLVHPELLSVRPTLTRMAEVGGSRKQALSALVTRLDTGLDVAVSGGKTLSAEQGATLAALCSDAGIVRLTWNGETLAQLAKPALTIDGIAVSPPPGAFLQATEAGEGALRTAVSQAVGPARYVADLFSGLGTFTLPLARTAEVHAVEGSAALVTALDDAARMASGLKAIITERRDLFRRPLEVDELARFDAVVIDPPRAGAEAQTARLAASAVPRIAAVSCNPQTFARDARKLVDAGYRVDWVHVVDQFRWSPHVELAAQLSHAHTGNRTIRRPVQP